jgi:ribonuclease HII
MLPRHFYHPEIDDSKKLSPKKREGLYEMITRAALSYAFGVVDSATIDQINILNATKCAMQSAIDELTPWPEIVLIDGMYLETCTYTQVPLVKGDTLSISIAAASILAKVKRDAIMRTYHKAYPQYHFYKHKGYPTKLHRQCLTQYGPCPIHRKTFRLL